MPKLVARLAMGMVAVVALLGMCESAAAKGECDGTQQPGLIEITSDGQLMFQRAVFPDFNGLNVALRGWEPDCLYILVDQKAPWSVVSDTLFSLGIEGNLQTYHHVKGRVFGLRPVNLLDNGPSAFRWINSGYVGRLIQLRFMMADNRPCR